MALLSLHVAERSVVAILSTYIAVAIARLLLLR